VHDDCASITLGQGQVAWDGLPFVCGKASALSPASNEGVTLRNSTLSKTLGEAFSTDLEYLGQLIMDVVG